MASAHDTGTDRVDSLAVRVVVGLDAWGRSWDERTAANDQATIIGARATGDQTRREARVRGGLPVDRLDEDLPASRAARHAGQADAERERDRLG
jgi:hypothetical protein